MKTYFFKNEYWGDDWQERESTAYDEEAFAEEIAEEWFDSDPDDPWHFEFDIEVKKGETGTPIRYSVKAEARVHFYASESED